MRFLTPTKERSDGSFGLTLEVRNRRRMSNPSPFVVLGCFVVVQFLLPKLPTRNPSILVPPGAQLYTNARTPFYTLSRKSCREQDSFQ